MAATATKSKRRKRAAVEKHDVESAAPSVGVVSERRVTIPKTSWTTYELLLRDRGERSRPRFTYDRGCLEIVSPTMRHDRAGYVLGQLIEFVALELRVPVVGVATTTYSREDIEAGFEGDNSYYVEHAAQMKAVEDLDLKVHPVPDIVIESDLTRSSLNKLDLFARFRVPEVWRIENEHVLVYVLTGDVYEPRDASAALPILTAGAMTRLLASGRSTDRPAWVDEIRAWVREQTTSEAAT